jgi:hypothetical protein
MIIVKKPGNNTEGTWFDYTLRDEVVGLQIRPFSAEVIKGIREKYKTVSEKLDKKTRQMQRQEIYDEDAITTDLVDYLLQGYRGFGDETGAELAPTKENKRLILDIPAVDEDVSLVEFVFTTARQLAACRNTELAAQAKN